MLTCDQLSGITGGAFRSLPGIWNSYTGGYVRLQEESGYKKVVLVRFEDLVTEPLPVMQRTVNVPMVNHYQPMHFLNLS